MHANDVLTSVPVMRGSSKSTRTSVDDSARQKDRGQYDRVYLSIDTDQ